MDDVLPHIGGGPLQLDSRVASAERILALQIKIVATTYTSVIIMDIAATRTVKEPLCKSKN